MKDKGRKTKALGKVLPSQLCTANHRVQLAHCGRSQDFAVRRIRRVEVM
jgi:hypothetical protein